MTDRDDEGLREFLEEGLSAEDRARLRQEIDAADADGSALRDALRGLRALDRLPRESSVGRRPEPGARRMAARWAALAAGLTLLVSVPTTAWLSTRAAPATLSGGPEAVLASGTYLLLLQRQWPDIDAIDTAERERRRAEYWTWTQSLTRQGRFVAAGELATTPGMRVSAAGLLPLAPRERDERFVVGMFIIRAESPEEASRIARESPHVRYGGTVQVRAMTVAAGLPSD